MPVVDHFRQFPVVIEPFCRTKEPVVCGAMPSAVRTFAPVVTVDGVAPAPPPTTIELSASKALDESCVVEEKYGIPPLVPPVTAWGKAIEELDPEHPTTPELL